MGTCADYVIITCMSRESTIYLKFRVRVCVRVYVQVWNECRLLMNDLPEWQPAIYCRLSVALNAGTTQSSGLLCRTGCCFTKYHIHASPWTVTWRSLPRPPTLTPLRRREEPYSPRKPGKRVLHASTPRSRLKPPQPPSASSTSSSICRPARKPVRHARW